MVKTVTLFLSTSPYSYENTETAAKITESALDKDKGHTVNLIGSGDGVYCFLKGQKAKEKTALTETLLIQSPLT
jgi:sulfur relay (sulfurtransferase) complex TusBCD TusD component (DsrE family)